MKLKLTFILILFIGKSLSSQISVQAVGYWDMNEKYEYKGSYQKYKVTGKDTVFESDMTYDVIVKITDSTNNIYNVLYRNQQLLHCHPQCQSQHHHAVTEILILM